MKKGRMFGTVSVTVVLAIGSLALGDVFNMPPGQTSLEMVTVANAGNAPDSTGYGAVSYTYRIGKFEITAAQYCEFLNAVAKTDTYGLYSTSMWSNGDGCKIQRSGTSGSYTYSVASDYANRPVNFVSWGDAARFANWLHNGQPTGAQGLATTEDGSYYLNGATDEPNLMAVTRRGNATWAIPTEDEWYKAAYHKNDGATGNYWDGPTRTDGFVGRDMSEATNPGSNANYYGIPFPIDSGIYSTTVAGEFQLSHSPYGTFDQGGNVEEWSEAILPNSYRVTRGGVFNNNVAQIMAAGSRRGAKTWSEGSTLGLRVVCQGHQVAKTISSSDPFRVYAEPFLGHPDASVQYEILNAGPNPLDPNLWEDGLHRHHGCNHVPAFLCGDPNYDPLAVGYVSANTYIDGADEVTYDNCSSAFYRFTFRLPTGAQVPQLYGSANVDDLAVLFLNGYPITAAIGPNEFGQDGSNILSWPNQDDFSALNQAYFVQGDNELVFGVMGDASIWGPTGLEFTATLTYWMFACNLEISYVNGSYGTVELTPEPNDANEMLYTPGTRVTLTAIPDPGKYFDFWKIYDPNHPGDVNYVLLDANNSTTIVMDADRQVTAVFSCYHLTVTVTSHPEWGYVVVEPNQDTYQRGTHVTLRAVLTDPTRIWTGWSGDVSPNDILTNPLTIVMNSDRDITTGFKCGVGLAPMLPLMAFGLGGLMAIRMVRRRRRRSAG